MKREWDREWFVTFLYSLEFVSAPDVKLHIGLLFNGVKEGSCVWWHKPIVEYNMREVGFIHKIPSKKWLKDV